MSLPFWYEKGREYAFDVLDGLEDAGVFKPEEAMEAWFLFHYGNGGEMFDIPDAKVQKDVEDLVRWALTVKSAQRQFAEGYRDAMRETRTSRRVAAHASSGEAL